MRFLLMRCRQHSESIALRFANRCIQRREARVSHPWSTCGRLKQTELKVDYTVQTATPTLPKEGA